MKTKRTTLVAFLLCAVLLLSIGFAALTDTLFITGEVEVGTDGATASFDQCIYFSNAEKSNDADSIVISEDSTIDTKDTATVHVYSLSVKDDTATFTLTIKNDSDERDALVTLSAAVADDDTNFSISCLKADDDSEIGSGVTVAKNGGTAQVKVVVTLKNTPVDAITTAIRVTLIATTI